MSRYGIRQSLLLLLAAVIWGVAFVAQSVGTAYVGPFTFNTARSLIGSLVLLPVIALFDKKNAHGERQVRADNKTLIKGGLCCGVCLFAAVNLQQLGIQYTTAGKAGFITAMYIILVPIFSIFLHKRAGMRIWIAVVIAVAGMYLLCGATGAEGLQMGDLVLFGCAAVFSLQILAVDYYAPKVDGIRLSCLQFLVCALLSGICMLLFEEPSMSAILSAWLPILYVGVLSTGVAYTLQIVGQKGLNPTVASLIMSLESVVSVLAGWLILGQQLSTRELLGCALAFAAIILVQLPEKSHIDI